MRTAGGRPWTPVDAITLLRDDHKTVEKLFKAFEKAGDRSHKRKADLVHSVIRERMSIHAAVEEQIFYPEVRRLVPDETQRALESLGAPRPEQWTAVGRPTGR